MAWDFTIWPPEPSPLIGKLARAIANEEGSNPIYNNPGDITDTYGFRILGTFGAKIPIFATLDDGVVALYTKLLHIRYGKSTVYPLYFTFVECGEKWANGDENWGLNVAKELGIDPLTTLGTYFSS